MAASFPAYLNIAHLPVPVKDHGVLTSHGDDEVLMDRIMAQACALHAPSGAPLGRLSVQFAVQVRHGLYWIARAGGGVFWDRFSECAQLSGR